MIEHRGDQAAEWAVWAEQFSIGTDAEGEVLDVLAGRSAHPVGRRPAGAAAEQRDAVGRLVPDARVILRKGQRVTVQVLSVEPWRQRISVSLRRALSDPWKEHAASYRKGRTARARVTQFAREEILIEFEDHVSGFIPRSEIAKE